MGNIDKKSTEISNPREFKKQYLSNPGYSFFEPGYNISNTSQQGFFEIVPLELIKSLHKENSFDTARRKFYTIVMLTQGTIKESIGSATYVFKMGTLYFISKYQLHTIHHWSKDVKGYHCIFDSDYFLLCLKHQVKLNEYPFFHSGKEPYIHLTATELITVRDLIKKLHYESCNRKSANKDLLVRLYLNALLLEVERIYNVNGNGDHEGFSRKEQLVAKFKKLVSGSLAHNMKISEYAQLLYVNPHYLNDTVKEITGQPASHFVHSYLISEAKAFLIQTNKTVGGIAETLNFTDQSYFCRFFKKHTGITPTKFRFGNQHKL